jgi:hypothetical protein
MYAAKQWRYYLEGCEGLTIVTDHHPNTFLQSPPVLPRRQARWYETFQRFPFQWVCEKEETNIADPLSRCAHSKVDCEQHREHVLAALTRADRQYRVTAITYPSTSQRGLRGTRSSNDDTHITRHY